MSGQNITEDQQAVLMAAAMSGGTVIIDGKPFKVTMGIKGKIKHVDGTETILQEAE